MPFLVPPCHTVYFLILDYLLRTRDVKAIIFLSGSGSGSFTAWHSPSLGQNMEFLVFGSGGQPFIVFPTSSGRFFDFENNGMVRAATPFIERGTLTLYCVDSIDPQSWDHPGKSPLDFLPNLNDPRYVGHEECPGRQEHPRLNRSLGHGREPRLALVAAAVPVFSGQAVRCESSMTVEWYFPSP